MKPQPKKPLPTRSWHLPVLDRMLLWECLGAFLSVLGVLITILVSQKFLGILSKAIEGEVAADTLLSLLALKTLSVAILLFPPALFLALLMVLGRMYRDQEMAILASSGVGPLRLYRSLAILVVPLGLLSTQLAWEVMPWTDRQSQQLLRQDEKSADVRGIKPGKFNEFSRGDVVLYAESKSGDEEGLSNIFVQSRHGEMAGVVTARDGYLRSNEDGEHFVVLRNGQRYQGSPGRADFIISNFDEYAVRIEEARGEDLVLKRAALPSRMLLYSKTPRDWVELQRRLAIPLGLFSLALLAVPLSRVAPRGGVYGNVLAAFMIYIIYENLQKLFQALVIGGKTPLWIGFGGVYVFMVLLAVLLLARENNYTWFRRAVRVEKNP